MANRFWVGGTGTWDRTTTTHWSASTGGAGGASAPGVSDVAIFDGASGGGTVTVTWDTGTVTLQSITCGAFTGTLDFAASDNNVTLSAAGGFNGSGSGARTINLGDGLWNLTANGATFTIATVTSLTFDANGSTIKFSGTGASQRSFQGGGKPFNIVQIDGNSAGGIFLITGANTYAALTISGSQCVTIPNSATQTITTLTLAGSAAAPVCIESASVGNAATISVASNAPSMNWAAFRDITCTGGATFAAANSFDLGKNTGITITPPEMTRARGFSGFA